MRSKSWRPVVLAALAALAAPGCSSPDLEPLPPTPGEPGPAAEDSPAEAPGPAPAEPAVEGPTPGDLFTPSRSGDRILAGVEILDPLLDPAAAVATFRLRNASAVDLPDLILAVVFAVPTADPRVPLQPRFESLEAPLAGGETREFRVALSARGPGENPSGFRVAAGMPEQLTAGGDGVPGTTFLGGLLECVELDADLTSAAPTVSVGLADRGVAASGAPLPALEGQLLIGRAGQLLWIGPWIVLPRSDPDGGSVRRVRWNLAGAPGLAGANLFLRIREKR